MHKIGLSSKKEKAKHKEPEPAPTTSHTFTRNYEIQTLSLKEALKNQVQSTRVKREEMKELNNRFDIEVSKCREVEQEVAKMQTKLSILQSKVKGLELQYENEKQKAATGFVTLRPPANNTSKYLPMMMTIRKIHQVNFEGGDDPDSLQSISAPATFGTKPLVKPPVAPRPTTMISPTPPPNYRLSQAVPPVALRASAPITNNVEPVSRAISAPITTHPSPTRQPSQQFMMPHPPPPRPPRK